MATLLGEMNNDITFWRIKKKSIKELYNDHYTCGFFL